MDHQVFDRFTKRFSAIGSRRNALRVAIGAALAAALAGDAAGKSADRRRPPRPRCRRADCKAPFLGRETPAFCCAGRYCSCGGRCCEDRCFWGLDADPTTGNLVPVEEFCCVGPTYVFCPTPDGKDGVCCLNSEEDPCGACLAPGGLVRSIRRP